MFVLGYEDEEDKVSEDDGKTFADISDWTERAFTKLIKTLSLVPTKKGTPFWALYDGNSIVSWYISRTADSKFNLYSNPSEIWYWKTFYLISKKSKWLRRLIEKKFQHKSLVIVLYLVYHIALQQCWTRVWKNQELGLHSSPLCFTLLRSQNSFKNLRKRHNFCKYTEQMVSTMSRWWLRTSRIQKTNRNSLKGFDMEVHVTTDVAENKKAGIQHNCSQKEQILIDIIQTSVQKFFLPKEKFTSPATKH